ncbi:2-keto-4-pentenoate hydratase [Janibacter melonis]|uniref:2-keto-4-pentenoate hydratase n=1 Tax=Janibacter melonis TaxID=262209 RepID=A0A5P8FPA7_9MICO|nr:2-keto-4-pentenoate hydratase [Janibacter melonis]MCB5991243.1 2-keto-4-pentenoate hydratase [Janibacter melonis]QFQ31416.2 2-keto-4-pentenoate hydratase [Janibacter melonis]
MGEPSQVQQEAAQRLLRAYETHTPIPPLTADYPELTVEDAYGIQLEQVRRWTEDGRTVVGHKVGLTSAAMQKQLGVTEPDFGHLFADFVYAEHEPIPADRFLQPRVEPEIAFVLKSPLAGPGVTVTQAIAAVDYVLPALEVVDSRVADWKITLADTIADNASSGGYVLGSTPTPLHEVDLRLVGCVFHRNAQVIGTGAGGAVLGSPITSLVWLANTLGALGTTLEAGEVILPGSVTAMSPVAPGDTFTATFAGLGSVTARFAHS